MQFSWGGRENTKKQNTALYHSTSQTQAVLETLLRKGHLVADYSLPAQTVCF